MQKTVDLLADDDAPPDDDVAKGTSKRVKPSACPFCGGSVGGAVAVEITAGAKPDFAVRCENCDAIGPWAITARLAVGLWNEGFRSSRPADGRRSRNESESKKQKTKQSRSESAVLNKRQL